MASEDYTQRAPATTHDEIGQLASAFNNMANTVQAYDIELRKATALSDR